MEEVDVVAPAALEGVWATVAEQGIVEIIAGSGETGALNHELLHLLGDAKR